MDPQGRGPQVNKAMHNKRISNNLSNVIIELVIDKNIYIRLTCKKNNGHQTKPHPCTKGYQILTCKEQENSSSKAWVR